MNNIKRKFLKLITIKFILINLIYLLPASNPKKITTKFKKNRFFWYLDSND
jgi:hypothetical protein